MLACLSACLLTRLLCGLSACVLVLYLTLYLFVAEVVVQEEEAAQAGRISAVKEWF